MSEQLRLQPHHRLLEIGTGSGYHAAVLSRLVRDVVSVERFKTLADRARARLKELNYANVEVLLADGYALPEGQGTFDRIMVTAAMAELPQSLLDLLDPDGILIAPIGPANGRQTLIRVQRKDDGFVEKPLVDVRFVPALRGIAREL
jgi:protein-L-isoaspartate(D-aspartate) O-methyltransferase